MNSVRKLRMVSKLESFSKWYIKTAISENENNQSSDNWRKFNIWYTFWFNFSIKIEFLFD